MNLRDTMNIHPNGHLQIGGVDTCDLAEQYGTPLYVMDEGYIRSVVRAFRSTIENTYGCGMMAYASKAFSCKTIYRIMREENVGIDVASGGEIYTALKAGFDLSKAYFHGNNKTEAELELAISSRVGTIVVDNLREIDLIDAICAQKGVRQNVLVRVNPGVEAHTHTYIQTATIDSKFGFSVKTEEANRAIERILSRPRLQLLGLHSHIGSQIFDRSAFVLAAEVLTDYCVKLKNEKNIIVRVLNLGGGFGVHYCEGDPKYDVKEYCRYVETLTDALNQAVVRKGLEKPFLVIEPGRSIVAEAGITLYRVGNIKEIENVRKYVAVDGGMTDNIRPALYDAQYEAILANRAAEEATEIVSIAGKCCESGDVLIKNARLPKAASGDLLAVFSTGAYNYSMSSNYNRILTPAVAFVRDGKSYLAIKRQTYDDLIRNDVDEGE